MTKRQEDEEEALKRKYAEELLDRNAKATIQSNNYNCSVKMVKFRIKKESLIKQVTCENCGKNFKTNSEKKICFGCQKN
ncbi:MAG: hypothetical protein ACLPWD_10175 [Methanobacterium sp.]